LNSFIQEYKDNFLKQQKLTYRRIYVSDSENDKLNSKYNQSQSNKDEIEKDFQVEKNASGWLNFYTEKSEEVTDEELSQYISMKLIQKLDGIDKKLDTMKNIMIFWLFLTILGMLVVLLFANH
jgi:rubrerythrin